MKTCKIENCNYPVWSKGLCKSHSPKTPLKKSYLSKKPTEKALKNREEKNKWLEELHQWEFDLFDKQKDEKGYCYCFESGMSLHESVYKTNLCIYSHILPKSGKYKKYAMKEWNVKIVHPNFHTLYESKSNKAPKQKFLFAQLKELYG